MLRQALFAWAFNPATREQAPPRAIAVALGRVARASLPVSALDARPRTVTGVRPGTGADRLRGHRLRELAPGDQSLPDRP